MTLATGIPEDCCRRINLGYLDPANIHLQEWEKREEEGILIVPRAGEMLYRVGLNPLQRSAIPEPDVTHH